MKNTLKYIALLVISGVIIPICQYTGPVQTGPVIKPVTQIMANSPIKRDGALHFSFMHDVAAKLLPALDFFK